MVDNKQSIHESIQAAYALNLCTVSVSQIIDYNDINILEQEYEAILNNLNLQNMPNDEALLNILKQLLDTITFFRISEGEKKLIERKYRQKMKNAIWNAVPNFGMLIAGGNPIHMAVSLASQVGIGYMNYRKVKAENDLELEEEMWKLQRSAIEQFNGLRRELFDTAWRLSKNYKFDDRLRLTERQINQYNTIIMDSDIIRRYQRLEAIQNNFEAYPPFWYYFGNAANEIARNPEISISSEIREYYNQKAYEHFNHYWQANQFALLREDHLASACALELVDIMIERNESSDSISEFIDNAVRFSGNSCDILQLCGIAYLNVGNYEKAYKTIKYLVNESYNASVNVQLLSGLLINEFNRTANVMYKAEYDILASRKGQKTYLLPWPGSQDVDYIDNQRNLILQKYRTVLEEYLEKYSVMLNEILPVPNTSKEYPQNFYRPEYRDKRLSEMKSIFAIKEKCLDYRFRLCNVYFSIRFIDTYNEFLANLKSWFFIDSSRVYEIAKSLIFEKQDVINQLQSNIQKQTFDINDYIEIQKLMAPDFAKPIYDEISDQLMRYVREISDMKKIAEMESHIFNFCEDQKLKQPNVELQVKTIAAVSYDPILSYELLGNGVSKELIKMSRKNRMIDCINQVSLNLTGHEKCRFIKSSGESFREYFENKKLGELLEYQDETLAILDDRSLSSNFDLIFTTIGLGCVIRDKLVIITTYQHVKYDDEKKCLIIEDNYNPDNTLTYDGKKIGDDNLIAISKLINELDEICSITEEQ